MNTFLFVSYPDNDHDAAIQSCSWTCQSATETGDHILVYVTGIGIKYEWQAVSNAIKVGNRQYECIVEYVRTFDPAISLDEICNLIPREEWPPPHLHFRGYASINIPEIVLNRLLSRRSSYKEAEINPNDAQTYCNRAWAYFDRFDYTEAIKNHTKAIQLNPHLVLAYHGRGVAYSYQARYEPAMEDYERAIKLDPTFGLTIAGD
jgi:tetratricopeptide (TPR) repeat protein